MNIKDELVLDVEALTRSIRVIELSTFPGRSVHAVSASLSILNDLKKSIIEAISNETEKENEKETK